MFINMYRIIYIVFYIKTYLSYCLGQHSLTSFENSFWKKIVARTSLQSVRTACTFTTILERFMFRGSSCTFQPPWRNLSFLPGFTAGW